jgi:hypothetical protein
MRRHACYNKSCISGAPFSLRDSHGKHVAMSCGSFHARGVDSGGRVLREISRVMAGGRPPVRIEVEGVLREIYSYIDLSDWEVPEPPPSRTWRGC